MMKNFPLGFFRNSRNYQSLRVNFKYVQNPNRSITVTKSDENLNFSAKAQTLYKQSCSNLLNEPRECVLKWLDSFDAIISDCDGVLWIFHNPIDGSVNAFNRFKELGKKAYFCTNNSSNTRAEILEKAQEMGFKITENNIITAAHSTAEYLKNCCFQKTVYIIGKEGLAKELDAFDIKHTHVGPDVMPENLNKYLEEYFQPEKDIGAVLIAFDDHFSYPKITRAASYLMDPDCLFIATNMDERAPLSKLILPGTGCFVRAVQACAKREPLVIGKPNPAICERLIKEKEIVPERTLMIGDSCNTDILLGYNLGFQTLLVGTGVNNLNDIECWKNSKDPEMRKLIPDTYLPKLADILQFMKS